MIKSCVFFLVFTITYKILRHVQHAMAPKPPKKLLTQCLKIKKVSFLYNVYAPKFKRSTIFGAKIFKNETIFGNFQTL